MEQTKRRVKKSRLIFTDLNSDGMPEVFDKDGVYATLAPVPAVEALTVSFLNRNITKLSVSPANAAYTYQWYCNNTPVPLAKQSSIYALLPGTYTPTIKDSCGTGVSLPYKVADIASTDNFIAGNRYAGQHINKKKISGNQLPIGKQLAAGVYLLQVMENNKLVYTQKIIKE